MRMTIEIYESLPFVNCVACNKETAVTRIVLNPKVAVLLCKTCLYEIERLFYRRVSADLEAIEKFGHSSKYSEVNIKLTFSGDSFRNYIDYSVEGVDEWGNSSHIASDIMTASLSFVISEIAKEVSKVKGIK